MIFTDRKEELPSMDIDDQLKNRHASSISSLNKDATKSNSTTDQKLYEIFASTKQKLQPTLDALKDKKDELLSSSKHSPTSSISSEFPRKSILRTAQSKSVSLLNADALLSAIKHQQQTENKSFRIIQSPETDWTKTAVNYGIDSGIQSKSNEVSPNEKHDNSISAIKRSYASLPISTPAVRNSNLCIRFKLIINYRCFQQNRSL
jgi:hypothetical protein